MRRIDGFVSSAFAILMFKSESGFRGKSTEKRQRFSDTLQNDIVVA